MRFRAAVPKAVRSQPWKSEVKHIETGWNEENYEKYMVVEELSEG